MRRSLFFVHLLSMSFAFYAYFLRYKDSLEYVQTHRAVLNLTIVGFVLGWLLMVKSRTGSNTTSITPLMYLSVFITTFTGGGMLGSFAARLFPEGGILEVNDYSYFLAISTLVLDSLNILTYEDSISAQKLMVYRVSVLQSGISVSVFSTSAKKFNS